MAQIVFVPHPQMGHVNPTIKLAKRLQRRGHQVSYLTIVDLEEYVASQGLGFLPVMTQGFPKGSLARQARLKLGMEAMWGALGGEAVDEIGKVLRDVRPDLLVIDALLRDLAWLARQAGIPCVLLSTSLDEYRLSLAEGSGDPADELPVLCLCPRDFDLPGTAGQTGRYYVEPSIDLERREPGPFPWDRLDPERPLIFCTLGSHCEDYKESEAFFRTVIEAMRQKPDWQLLLALGNPHVDPGTLHPVPPNVLLVSWAPQLAVLEKASLMMTHGGLGTIKECIFFGVPMIVFPINWDQPRNAARVVHHGLGVQGNIGDSAGQIGRLIDRVAGDSSFTERAQAMSRVFRKAEESGAGAGLIEKILLLTSKR
jgi:UDP:flavonoid glycosyltransferase YjiC (YdhE family)